MKITLYTNVDERCGNAAYARALSRELTKYFGVVETTTSLSNIVGDVVIVNWHPARVGIDAVTVRKLQAEGRKVLLIWQNSYHSPLHVAVDDILAVPNAVVAHEPVEANVPIHYIPHGIPELPWAKISPAALDMAVGTAGFQFDWKQPHVVIEAARRYDLAAKIVCPDYPGVIDAKHLAAQWARQYNRTTTVTDWLDEEAVIVHLSHCLFNIFWFRSQGIDDQLGQTGSARMGIAARRPMIISRHRKFKTLLPYEDELYIADTEEDVYRLTKEILAAPGLAKCPKRILDDTGWSKTGKMYADLIEAL